MLSGESCSTSTVCALRGNDPGLAHANPLVILQLFLELLAGVRGRQHFDHEVWTAFDDLQPDDIAPCITDEHQIGLPSAQRDHDE